nr:transporter substrate-binding domain-containing protein [Hyphomonas sp.]
MVRLSTRFALAIALAISALSAGEASAQQAALDRIKRTGTINVCADPVRLPYSNEKMDPPGFDLEFSQALAQEMGFKLGVVWHSTHRGTKIVRQLADGTCDFFPGFPVDASFEESNFRIIMSKPYYSSGFATLARSDAPETILADSKKKGVGVQMGTLPDFRLFDRGYERKLYKNTKEMIEAIVHKEIDAAVVPALEGGFEVKTHGAAEGLKVLANTEKDFVFPMAVGFRKADKELRDMANAAIEKIKADGRLDAIFKKYGMVALAGTGGGEAPKSKAQAEDGDGKPAEKNAEAAPAAEPEKKAEAAPAPAPAPEKKAEAAAAPAAAAGSPEEEKKKRMEAAMDPSLSPHAALATMEGLEVSTFKPGEDPGADWHGLAINPEFAADTTTVEDFPTDAKSIDRGRKLYKQACYKCHGNNGVQGGGVIPDLRKFASENDHYAMFAVVQA